LQFYVGQSKVRSESKFLNLQLMNLPVFLCIFLQTGGKFYLNMIFTFKNSSIFVVFKKMGLNSRDEQL